MRLTALPLCCSLAWMWLVYALSGAHPSQLPKFDLLSADKFGHAAAYATMTALFFWTLYYYNQRQPLSLLQITSAILLASSYGALMEVFQYCFFEGRTFDFADMLANVFGALLTLLVYKLGGKKWLHRL